MVANPTNNNFENWTTPGSEGTSGDCDNWAESANYGSSSVYRSGDSYAGSYSAELGIDFSNWSGLAYVQIESEAFVCGTSTTYYVKSVEGSWTGTYFIVYVIRDSDEAVLYTSSSMYPGDGLTTTWQQKTIDSSGFAGTSVRIKFEIYDVAVCLPDNTKIDTIDGYIKVNDIKIGDEVIGGKILDIRKIPRPKNHKLYLHKTVDGQVVCSKEHPFISKIVGMEEIDVKTEYLCDILTTSGKYRINGVWLKSTIERE